jgi:hypothetical protein
VIVNDHSMSRSPAAPPASTCVVTRSPSGGAAWRRQVPLIGRSVHGVDDAAQRLERTI